MPKAHAPRKGSMGVWPRVKAKRHYSRIRAWANTKDTKALGFAGYKAGMTHLMFTDNRPNTMTKGQSVVMPVTIIECPPIKVHGIVFYNKSAYGLQQKTCVLSTKFDKHLAKKLVLPKQAKTKDVKPEDYDLLRLLVHTNPSATGIGKKKPEVFEIGVGGNNIAEQYTYAKEQLGKELNVSDIFQEGEQVDIHAITTGKGFQGPVKRQGVSLRSHKSEKGVRGPANLGPWAGNRSWTVAHAGQTGFHQRTDYNKWLVKVGTDAAEIMPKGDFVKYGKVKANYVLLKGSVAGPKKRLIRFNKSIRPNKKISNKVPPVEAISLKSQQ